MKTVVHYWWIAVAIVTFACNLDRALSESDHDVLTWNFTNNASALCNDFTRAGFFHRPPVDAGERRWVIFLESGSFCYSNETCNRRYFQQNIRNMYNGKGGRSANGGLGDFNTTHAWTNSGGEAAAMKAEKKRLVEIVNPLMTSLSCYNNTGGFSDSFTLQGRDVLNRALDSSFRDHGHVVIPYCSSDVWLGSEENDTRDHAGKTSTGSQEYCDCWDTNCFKYKPDSSNLQFTFRGKTIFESVVRTLDEMYDLQGPGPKEIILMGSSAGGLGVLNLARWVRDEYPHVEVKAVVDSSWFINFRGGINEQFDLLHLNNTKEEEKEDGEPPPPSPSSPSLPTPSTSSDLPPSFSPTPSMYLPPSPTILPVEGSGSGSGEYTGEGGDFKRSTTLEELVNEMNSREKREDESETKEGIDPDLLLLISSHDACSDIRQGFPCCLSAQCLLSESNPTTNEPYFPSDIPLFVITSLYDVFILAPALVNLELFQSTSGFTAGLALEFLTTIGEYGGAMNASVKDIEKMQRANFSFYVSQCFQHIYLASSTLWGDDALFGTSPIIIEPEIATFRHSIQPGIWNTRKLAYKDGESYTIMEALNDWYENGTGTYRDVCHGPYCNLQCPEEFTLNDLGSNTWPLWAKITIAGVVVCIAVLCLVMKSYFILWLKWLERKQNLYLRSIIDQEARERILPGYVEEDLKREFPICTEDQAISVACFNLHYSVTTRVGQQLKDEKKDNQTPIVLTDLRPEEELNGSERDTQEEAEEEDELLKGSRRNSAVASEPHTGPLQKIKKALTPMSTGTYKVPTFRRDGETLATSLQRMANGSAGTPNASPYPPHGRISRESNVSQDTYEEVPVNPSRADFYKGVVKRVVRTKRKKILKGISVYFNPGELIGIMGPSGCGKTTFLDILTGRRKTGTFSGQIFINGIPMEENLNWYISNTGYVIQLATPYYEELTVRENLTLAAWIKLTNTRRERFQRVEQVMDVTGLLELADTEVGGATGPGLSGGQKRRLAVALQLLKLPSVIFLDEPTSGLDAASSRELLAHLNDLAASNRTVVLTIHQPRLEIFHMFHRLVLLSDGKVAYHGVPEKAYEVFVNALRSRYLQQRLVIPDLEDRNPADVIMDMLGNQRMRQLITDYYQSTDEPRLVSRAVGKARFKERSLSIDLVDGEGEDTKAPSRWDKLKFILHGPRQVGHTHNSMLSRLAALEARGAKRATLSIILYLPVIFFAYGFLLGTVYFQRTKPVLIMSGFCVYSVASALFMFPALYTYYQRALNIYSFEHADGVGKASDLVIQPFVRFISMAFLPVVVCAWILYLLLVDYTRWSWDVFAQVVLVNVALNQTWTALLIWLILTFPVKAFRLSPVLSAVAGFTSGFFIPINEIPWWYRWLTYINPNYYGFSASSVLLLTDFQTECEEDGGSDFECYVESGEYILNEFNFGDINPYRNIVILLGMTIFFLLMAVISNWWTHTTLQRGMNKVILVARKISRAASLDTSSVFSVSLGGYEYDSDRSDDGMSTGDELEEREDILEPKESLEEEVAPAVHSPLSPISEKMEELAAVEEEELEEEDEEEEGEERRAGASTWEYPMRYPQVHQRTNLILPTSLPEIPSAVSPQPGDAMTPHSKARANWKKALHGTLDRQPFNFEMDVFSGSEPQTPTQGKHVMFEDGLNRTSRIDHYGHRACRRARRKKSTRSVYLHDGEIHAVWKPGPKQTSARSSKPTTPSPPPGFADVVQMVMKQKHDLQERQRKLFSRVTATQAVLKEQNEELATVAEVTEDEEEEDEKKGTGSDDVARSDTPSKKMWKKAINTVVDSNKGADSYKKKRDRKRSTVHFHNVVTNKMATLDSQPGGTGTRYRSTSDNGGSSPTPKSPKAAQKFKRNASLSTSRRAGAITPSGAIPFTEWKSQFYQRQRMTRQEAMKHFQSDYNIHPHYVGQSLPRYCSDDNIHLPGRRASSIHRADDLEPPRSKSVSQSRYMRRCSSPDILGLDDRDDLSDASVPLDGIISPSAISTRSNSPAVFSDEEERRSKLRTHTPLDEGPRVHTRPPLAKQDSAELHSPGPLSNIKKRAQKRNQHRQMYTDSVIEADIEAENIPFHPSGPKTDSVPKETHPPRVGPRRPKRVSLSLPTSPRATPSPHPLTPILSPHSTQSPSPRMSPAPARIKKRKHGIGVSSPADLNERISQKQWRRDSMQHIASNMMSPENNMTGGYVERSQSVSPDFVPPSYTSSHYPPNDCSRQRRSSSPLNSLSQLPKERRLSTPTPPLQNPPAGADINQVPPHGGQVNYNRKISQTSVGSATAATSSGRVRSPPPGAEKLPVTRI